MSASNWTICPRCVDRARDEVDEKNAELYAKYGKVSPEEWEIIKDGIKLVNVGDYRTFREDYEFIVGAKGETPQGVVTVEVADIHAPIGLHIIYRGRCTVCDLKYEHRSFEPFYDRVHKKVT